MPLEIVFKSSYQIVGVIILHLVSFALFYQVFSGSLLWGMMIANTISLLFALWQTKKHHRIWRIRILPNRIVWLYCPQKEEVVLHFAYVTRYCILAQWQGNQTYWQVVFPWMCSRQDFRRLRVILAHEAVVDG